MAELIVKASVLEDGLIEQVEGMIERNPRLFDNEKVVLMADAHKTSNEFNTNSVPVGFTMTLSKGLIPVDYVSADMFCGVTSYLIKDWVPSNRQVLDLSRIARDILPVNRRFDEDCIITDLGTLGNGNHFIEIGTNGKDTLVSVHSGSRDYGGQMFKKHKELAKEHTKKHYYEERIKALEGIMPRERQAYLKSLPKPNGIDLLDTNIYKDYWIDLEKIKRYAEFNRLHLLSSASIALLGGEDLARKPIRIESVHNYIDTSGNVPILRKGSIQAKHGDKVVIPINMRDGIILGTVSTTEEVNYSLPHGAGRVLSRTKAFEELDLEQFKEDMKDVVSPTVGIETLDESPRAYKDIDVILKDIEPHLSEYEIFKPIFNYKGI